MGARPLNKNRIPFEAVNIWENPEAAARVRAVADGYETVPTFFIGERVLVNPSVDQVEATLREVAPQALANRPPRKRWFGRA